MVVVIVLGILVWQQRTSVQDEFDKHKCDLSATFFGIHLDAPDSVKQACAQHTASAGGGGPARSGWPTGTRRSTTTTITR